MSNLRFLITLFPLISVPLAWSETPSYKGYSGGALVCRYSKFAREELVGIVMSFGRARDTREIRYNSFSPVFGLEAKRLLNN
jgi:hypothetical protein